ncbi:hypothetical protein ABD440_20170, partial [Chromobacterium piscinae]
MAHIGEEAALGLAGLLCQLFGLQQPRFRALAFGDVGGDADIADDVAAGGAHRGHRQRDGYMAAVLAHI